MPYKDYEYGLHKARERYWRNREAKVEYARKYREKHKDRINKKNRELYPHAEGRCAICPREGKLLWDHCHKSGRFRAWICHRCNTALGLLADDLKLLERMRQYLEEHAE
jgi:hypothetical protein